MIIKENINVDDLLDELSCVSQGSELKSIEEKFSCKISLDVEKHNSLQYTYYFNVDFGLDENLFIEIESGINNGTQLNECEWGNRSTPTTKDAEVLKDIILNENYYKNNPVLKAKAGAILKANKSKLFDFHRQNNYDNYVTGGNSKMKLDPLLAELELEYIYEVIEVDRTFINK